MIQWLHMTGIRLGIAMPLLTLFVLGVAGPLGVLLFGNLPADPAGISELRHMAGDASLQSSAVRTLGVALLACTTASLVAIPAAFVAVRARPWVRHLVQLFGVLPLAMPPFVSAGLLLHGVDVFNQSALAHTTGSLRVQGSDFALAMLLALHYFPLILFSVIHGLQRIDRSLEESARNLGAGRLQVHWRILWPLTGPTYAFAAGLMMLRILEDVGTPLILGVDGMLAPLVLQWLGSGGPADPLFGLGAALLLVLSLTVAALTWNALLAPLPSPGGTFAPRPPPRHSEASGWLLITLVGALAVAPFLWLVIAAIGSEWRGDLLPAVVSVNALQTVAQDWLPMLATTLRYAAGVAVFVLLVGASAAVVSARADVLGRSTRFTVAALFAVPGVVLAGACLYTAGMLGIPVPLPAGIGWLTLALVVGLKQVPLAHRLLQYRLQIHAVLPADAARSLGVRRPGIRQRFGLAALSATLGAVFVLAGGAAVAELSVALALMGNTDAPVALAVFHALGTPSEVLHGLAAGMILTVALALGLLLVLALTNLGRVRAPREAD